VTDPNSGAPVVDCNGQPTYSGEIFNSRLAQQSTLNNAGYCGVPFGYANGLPSNVIPSNVIDPLAARLGPDLVLPKALAAHDLVLLDQNPRVRSQPDGNAAVWVVKESASLCVRYLRMKGATLFLANEVTLEDPQQWHSIPLAGRNILDIVRARIVWICREMEKEPAGPADPAC